MAYFAWWSIGAVSLLVCRKYSRPTFTVFFFKPLFFVVCHVCRCSDGGFLPSLDKLLLSVYVRMKERVVYGLVFLVHLALVAVQGTGFRSLASVVFPAAKFASACARYMQCIRFRVHFIARYHNVQFFVSCGSMYAQARTRRLLHVPIDCE